MKAGIACGLLLAAVMAAYYGTRPPGETLMTAAPVPFVVVTHPPGCDIYLDGARVGTSSGDGRLSVALDPSVCDVRWIEARHAGFESTRWAASAYGGLPGVVLHLARKPVDVFVSTIPTGAEVWIDDALRGFSPLTTQVLVRDNRPIRVAARGAGYEPIERTIDPPEPGETGTVEFRLTPGAPAVAVVTDPPGAELEIDGAAAGKSPLTHRLPVEKRGQAVHVVARLARHELAEREVQIPARPGPPAPAYLRLDPALARLVVETTPSGALLRVNGRDAGAAPRTIRLTDAECEGPIRVEALLDGAYFGQAEIATVAPGESRRVALPLELYAQRVALAIDCAGTTPGGFELLRDRLKERIHGLSGEQRFALFAAGDGRVVMGPDEHLVAAAPRQKIRAYDRADELRVADGAAAPTRVLAAAMVERPQSVWLFTDQKLDRAEFLAALDEGGTAPSVQIVSNNPAVAEPWLREWLTAHRGWLFVPGEEQTVDARVANPRSK
ncbi:MAG: PEGA domain-containing protein [Phycisphaerae bacterium]